VAPPFQLNLSVWPPTIRRRCYSWSSFISTLLLYILECVLLSLTVLFLNVFRYKTSFTYTGKHVLSIIGVIFSVFLGSDEQLHVFECAVAVRSVIGEDGLPSRQGGYVLLAANKSTQLKPDLTRWEVGKAMKYGFALYAVGHAREKGSFHPFLNFKYSIQAVNFRWPTHSYCGPPIFRYSPTASQKLSVAGGNMAHVEYHRFRLCSKIHDVWT
jgi:hypothetical protein